MRITFAAAAILLLSGFGAYAQNTDAAKADPNAKTSQQAAPPVSQQPADSGADTTKASKAYQGGGVVLQGAPGAPAPTVQPTPPNQAPKNAVPQ